MSHRSMRPGPLAGSALLAGLRHAGAGAQEPAPGVEEVRFSRDIRPILSDACFKCHGPDKKANPSGLRLDMKEGLFGAVEPGRHVVVPGRPDRSELFLRITAKDRDDLMPPAKTGKKLSRPQVELLRKWIAQGAPWEGHWAFLPPRRPAPPEVRDTRWPRGEIDRFLLARLEKEGLNPSPEEDRWTLARRAALDLTGLPPAPEEAEAFVKDPAPDAWERYLDRLLKSPRYGEHMARFWLDAARYGDTHGLHLDNYREIWPYREWVINAFNANMPFDRFVTEQLAGDLLPPGGDDIDRLVATGFLRCNVTTSEGGSIEEEVYVRNVVDRVDTFGTVFFGLTVACARCHDHKYDPISQKDYYRLFAFLNSEEGSPLDGNRKDHAPVARVPAGEERGKLAAIQASLRRAEARLAAPLPELDQAQARWEAEVGEKLRSQWAPLETVSVQSQAGTTFTRLEDGSTLAGGPNPPKETYTAVFRAARGGIRALRLEALTHPSLPHGGAGRAANSNFVLSEFEAEALPAADGAKAKKADFTDAQADYSQKGFEVDLAIDGKPATGWAVDGPTKRENRAAVFFPKEPLGDEGGVELRVRLRFENGGSHAIGRFRLSAATDAELLRASVPAALGDWSSIGPFPAAGAKEAFETAYLPEQEVDLKKTYLEGKLDWQRRTRWLDGTVHTDLVGENCATYLTRTIDAPTPREVTLSLGSDDTITAWLNGKRVLAHEAYRPAAPDQEKLVLRLEAGENRLLLKICNAGGGHGFYFKRIAEELGGIPAPVAEALGIPAEKRSDAQKASLRESFRRERWPDWKALDAERRGLREQERGILDKAPTTLVFKERATPREAFILKRGEYDRRLEKVDRGTPSGLPAMAADLPRDRLGLARWLLDPAHPLTTRVTVNRLWQQVFGIGLARTSEDFGSQGEPPAHPDLLDHLATRFAADGWDVKKLMRDMLASAAYRQSSRVTPELLRRDPENRLLARGPRFRLDAETVRDQLLFVSGLLVERIGGPSVKPPQPEGLWEAVGYTGSNTFRFQRDPEAQKVFRRSLYIFWKRTSAPPQMTTLDAPSREACRVRRERTNTPLQALLLMNEPQCFEAARHLAQKAVREGGASPEERAAWMLRRCTVRPPAGPDVADLVAAYRDLRATWAKNPAEAKKAVAFGDLPPDPAIDPAELAAWTLAASVVLNLDEFVSKR